LALTNGHGRRIAGAPFGFDERTLASVEECPFFFPFHFRSRRVTGISLLKPPFGGFRIKTVTWIQKWF
jgi:hypothetical protein